MPENLASVLHNQRIASLIGQAETIAGWPNGSQREEYAKRHVREARLLRVLGNISQQEEYQIFTILSFVMDMDAAAINEHCPDNRLEPPPPPPEPDAQAEADLACYLGCPACDDGGRMRDDPY